MHFFRNSNGSKFIYTDDKQCMIISFTETTFSVTGYQFPFAKLEGEVLEDSSYDEFFGAYDRITSRFTGVAINKPNKGLRALLKDAPYKHKATFITK